MLIGILQYRISLAECAPCKCLEKGAYLECVSRPFFPQITEFPDLTENEKSKIIFMNIGRTFIRNLPSVTKMEYPELNFFNEAENPSLSCDDVSHWYSVFSYIERFISDSCSITRVSTGISSIKPFQTTSSFYTGVTRVSTGIFSTSPFQTSTNIETSQFTTLTENGDIETSQFITSTENGSTSIIDMNSSPFSLVEIITLAIGCVLVIVIITLSVTLYKRKRVDNINDDDDDDDITFSNPMFNLEEIELQNVTSIV